MQLVDRPLDGGAVRVHCCVSLVIWSPPPGHFLHLFVVLILFVVISFLIIVVLLSTHVPLWLFLFPIKVSFYSHFFLVNCVSLQLFHITMCL